MATTRRAVAWTGVVILTAGVVLVFMPLTVAEVLNRPRSTPGELINLRASWGGALAGLGAFLVAHRPRRTWWLVGVELILWFMVGVGLARAVGFVQDGDPDTMQWVWLVAEAGIAVACVAVLARESGRQSTPPGPR